MPSFISRGASYSDIFLEEIKLDCLGDGDVFVVMPHSFHGLIFMFSSGSRAN